MHFFLKFLPETSHKTKIFINMVIAQVGFLLLTVSVIFFHSDTYFIITINIIFGVVLAFLSWATYYRIEMGFNVFKQKMNNLIDFSFMRTNLIPKVHYEYNDEIGLVLKELDKYEQDFDKYRKEDMKVMGEIILTLDKMSQGIYKCRIYADSHNFMIKALRDTINKTLDINEKNITSLKDVATEYANDDFTNKVVIDPKIKADMLEVMTSINALGDALSKSAKLNLSNGQKLETNASTMSNSVNNFATKANQQASSLEQTAASLEKITLITRNNTTNATKMSELGNTVKSAVSKGSKLAGETSIAMDEINKQVTAINDAISVIDQISFQTNILSLNAAVEAATAGEAGKGFAVVAQEVRNLASRSSDAANEIKSLVEKATQKANQGKIVSDDMIKGYEAINTHFNETINLIEDVSSASKEQMSGIEQINDAVNILDKATQENANEANLVAQIANDVNSMANNLVSDAQEKKFN